MRRLINLTTTALVVFAAVSAVAVARDQDYVPPDARGFDAARQLSSPRVDLRSPDARDSARQLGSPQIDLRSPDARDASRQPVETYTPGHLPQPSPVVSVVSAPTGGFDWADAGIGAAGMLALVALGCGALVIASQRRRDGGLRPAGH